MNKALIIIDAQKGFMNRLTEKVPQRIKSFIKRHGGEYELLIFTQYLNRPNSMFVKALEWKGFMTLAETDIVDELVTFVTPKNLFQKYTYGSFVDNKLFNVLKRHKIQQVELAGFDTENCVLTFARDAFDRGMTVVVYKNLTASSSRLRLYKTALEIIKYNIGKVK